MPIKMAGLSRIKTGRYVGRKLIPRDVCEEYARRFGPRHEAKFSMPSTTSEPEAKEKFAAWLSEVEGRIRAIRGGKPATAPMAKVKASATPWRLFEQWATEVKPAASTVARWRPIFQSLETQFGDKTITEDGARAWARSQITAKRAPITVRDICLSAAKTVYAWAKEQRLVTANPFSEVKITVPRKTTTRESKAFNQDEVDFILTTAVCIKPQSTFAAAQRWVPWLLAYSGARGSEICQLRGKDIEEREGQWFMRLTPDAGTIKTKRARIVPIHDHLIEQGFINWVEKCGKGPLFYNADNGQAADDPMKPRQPRSFKTRQRLGAWVRSLGINDKEVSPTHGFRHLFKQICDRAGISERVSDAITGHSPATVGRSYGAPTASDMAAALKKFPRHGL